MLIKFRRPPSSPGKGIHDQLRDPLDLFLFFFVSGFCGLLYQVVWMRLAFARFGINTPVLSVVLSVFMAGLALGSWLGGRLSGAWGKKDGAIALRYYGAIECLTGFGAYLVPHLFAWGAALLLPLGGADSGAYLFASAAVLLFSLLPWCLFMGATFPFMTAFLKAVYRSEEGFSFLYTANVLGAMAGVLTTAVVLIECLGFQRTLCSGRRLERPDRPGLPAPERQSPEAFVPLPRRAVPPPPPSRSRAFNPRSAPAFHHRFRFHGTGGGLESSLHLPHEHFGLHLRLPFVFLPARHFPGRPPLPLAFEKRVPVPHGFVAGGRFRLFFFAPFARRPPPLPGFLQAPGEPPAACPRFLWGYLTPKLVDQFSRGNPRTVGKGYAANVLGCILGPLAASYLLLPAMSCRNAMILLSLPLGLFFLLSMKKKSARSHPAMGWAALSLALFALSFKAMDYEEGLRFLHPEAVVHRDYTATTVSIGSGMRKELYVNGVGVTGLLPPTKMMAHLPLVLLSHPPQSVLDICFGMGTTYRSLMSWGVSTTAVDLVPSVFKAFTFYHSDAPAVLADPLGRRVADDGRRFLQRTEGTYDLITIDPPPPVEAAGSSLLYSTGFYDQAKKRLKKDGLLQQWIPSAEPKIVQAVARSLVLSFPYVRVFAYPLGYGYHFIASRSPIPAVTPRQMVKRMPASAIKDMVEWTPQENPERLFVFFLGREVDPQSLLNADPRVVVTDDQPYNEYFLVRRLAALYGFSPKP